jgi:hypothetical protein
MERLLIEDIDQHILDMLVDMRKQRTVFAECITSILELPFVEQEGIALKRTIAEFITESMMDGLKINDNIEFKLSLSILNYLIEERNINMDINSSLNND